jgi:hypothetical protein
VRIAQVAGEQLHHLPRDVQGLPKVPRGQVRDGQGVPGGDLDVEGVAGGGQDEGTPARCDGAFILACVREGNAQMTGDPPKPLVIVQSLGEELGCA